MKTSAFIFIALVAVCGNLFAQQPNTDKDLSTFKYSIEEANDWTSFLKRESGWFGGDGIYTIPLNGKEEKSPSSKSKTLFIFSDSMIGEIKNDSLVPGSKMIHNAVAILQGDKPDQSKVNTWWDKDKNGRPESVFIPTTPQTIAKDYYWLGDGFTNQEKNNAVYIFGYRVRQVAKGAFGFKEVGNTLIKLETDGTLPFKSMQQMDTPLYLDKNDDSGSFGTGIYVNTKKAGAPNADGYIYVYGVRGKAKRLMVARVLPRDFEAFDKWTYWTGKSWSSDMNEVADITDHVSNEISVSAMPDGRYILVFQVDGISNYVGVRIGSSPYGPFGPIIKVWDCSSVLTQKSYLVYNAKGHPSISKPGELLISFNVNSREFGKDLKKNPLLYRPRFLRLKFL